MVSVNVECSHNPVPTSRYSALIGAFACVQTRTTANAADIMHRACYNAE